MRRASLVFLLVAAVAVAAGAPAWAHPVPGATPAPAPTAPLQPTAPVPTAPLHEVLAAAMPEPELPWTAVALLVAVAVAVLLRRRRVLALTLVLVVGLLAFETGLHSTYHLDNPDDAARCIVAGMASQLSADLTDATVDANPSPAPESSVSALTSAAIIARPLAPDAGRAPPVLSV
jgi:hypothetical protein